MISAVHNLRVMFDKNMSMDSQVKAVTQSAYYHLQTIRKVMPF